MLCNVLSGLTSLLGVVVVLAGSDITESQISRILFFGIGIFIYIGATDIMADVTSISNVRDAVIHLIAFIVGVVAVSLTMLRDTHCEVDGAVHNH